MKHLAVLLATLSLAGCISMGSNIPSPNEGMAAIRARWIGHPIGEAVTMYGVPDGQTLIQGHKVFIWHRSNNMTYSKPETVTTHGAISNPAQYPWASAVPYVESSTYNRRETVQFQCVLSLGTDAKGDIDGAAINGQMGACQVFVL